MATAHTFDPSKVAAAAAAPDWADPASWPDPDELPAGAPEVEPFDLDMLPASLRPWTADLCERMQIPADFPAIAQMVEAGALIAQPGRNLPEATGRTWTRQCPRTCTAVSWGALGC